MPTEFTLTGLSTNRNTVLVDLNASYGLIAVSGVDAATFLQGQLTCDIREVTPTKPGFGACCTQNGRIRALLRIFLHHDTYYLQLPASLLSSMIATLTSYGRFSKIYLEDASSRWSRFGIYQPQPYAAPSKAEPQQRRSSNHSQQSILPTLYLGHLEKIARDDLLIFPMPSADPTVYSRFELLGASSAVEPLLSLRQAIEQRGFTFWQFLEIHSGIPEIWPETTEQLLPHTLNLPALGAVSFNKGCYCGQEIIARMEYKANLKRRMFHAICSEIPAAPAPGSPIRIERSQETVGTVIRAIHTTAHSSMMLVETREDYYIRQENFFITLNHQIFPISLTEAPPLTRM